MSHNISTESKGHFIATSILVMLSFIHMDISKHWDIWIRFIPIAMAVYINWGPFKKKFNKDWPKTLMFLKMYMPCSRHIVTALLVCAVGFILYCVYVLYIII